MSADFLVELGTEELPPKALLSLSEAFTQGIVDRLKAENLNFGEVTAFAAPRRLALVIKNLDAQAPNSELVAWGPPVAVAFDAEGQPTRAAEAFAKKNGLDVNELDAHIENDGQQDKLCVRRIETGAQTNTLLADVINGALGALPIPKRMRWGQQQGRICAPGAVGGAAV